MSHIMAYSKTNYNSSIMIEMFFKIFFKIVKAINSNASKRQIAIGFALGAVLGLMPGFNFTHLLMFIFVYLFEINIPFVFVGMIVYKLLLGMLAMFTTQIGTLFLVRLTGFKSFWTFLYNLPIVPWTRFYNTAVLGGLVFGLLVLPLNYFVMKTLIVLYRQHVQQRLEKIKFFKVIKSSKLWTLYKKYSNVKGAL